MAFITKFVILPVQNTEKEQLVHSGSNAILIREFTLVIISILSVY